MKRIISCGLRCLIMRFMRYGRAFLFVHLGLNKAPSCTKQSPSVCSYHVPACLPCLHVFFLLCSIPLSMLWPPVPLLSQRISSTLFCYTHCLASESPANQLLASEAHCLASESPANQLLASESAAKFNSLCPLVERALTTCVSFAHSDKP